MNYNPFLKSLFIGCFWWLLAFPIAAQVDSLTYYLQEGLSNNALVRSRYLAYQAMVEKIPQAKAYKNPTLEVGVALKPMAVLYGKPVADFKLMQSFDWIGTRKAARLQAKEGAKKSLAVYAMSRDELIFQIKKQWYTLCMLKEKEKNAVANAQLYQTLKDLVLKKYANSPLVSSRKEKTSMSTVLRVELELLEINNQVKRIHSRIQSAEVQFNALLNRDKRLPVHTTALRKVPSSITRLDDAPLILRNPQLQQQKAQQNFYAAKQRVDQLMGYPSFGLGVKYSWVDKRMGDVIPVTSMNGKNMIMPMLSISLPLYRSKYNAMKRETRFNEQAASKQYQELQIRLEAQYMELLNELSDADRSIDLYAQQATLANTTYQLMLDEYATEKTTLSAIIEVQKQLLRYQFDQLAAISHYNTIVASLEKIVSQQPLINTTHENK